MSISPVLNIFSTTIAMMKSNSLPIPIIINCEGNKAIETLALINSGARENFIDQNYARESGFILET